MWVLSVISALFVLYNRAKLNAKHGDENTNKASTPEPSMIFIQGQARKNDKQQMEAAVHNMKKAVNKHGFTLFSPSAVLTVQTKPKVDCF